MKPTLLVPMAGLGKRFLDKGFVMPKQLIMVDDRHIIDYSFDSIDWKSFNLIFIVRQEHINNFSIDTVLKQKFGEVTIIPVDAVTQGSVCSCLLAKDLINNESPLVIYCLDVYFKPKFHLNGILPFLDGLIPTFKANSPLYSYIEADEDNFAIRTAEKKVISSHAAVGIYYFKHGKTFVRYGEEMIKRGLTTNGEYYITPVYNLLIDAGMKVGIEEVDKMYVLGTPEEMHFFVKNVAPQINFGKKPIALCADHSGVVLKNIAREVLNEFGIEYIDFGTYTEKDCDYNDYVSQAASHIGRGLCDFGFGFCRTGQGVNIVANKFKHLRAGLVFDEYTAEHAIKHNCCNFFSFPSKYVDEALFRKMLEKISTETFDGGRHSSRMQKTEQYALS